MKSSEQPTLTFESKKKWAQWLKKEHDKSRGVWMKLARKSALQGHPRERDPRSPGGIRSITYEEALDVALTYGWIDGQKKAFDDTYWLQKFTPRGPRSIWSKINTEKAERLIASGEMTPSGLAAIEAAKQDGRWQAAYAGQKKMNVPEDLQAALNKNKKAKDFFATLTGANRYSILFRIETAKRPETRLRRIQQFVEMLAKGETVH
jgi:uncharacterized protein YdeI (YjbR/CyaY-like superfamily)